jgi:hypothetical protein
VAHPELHEARLHVVYLPTDQHRWFFPLVNRNGSSFSSYISGTVFSDANLKNAFASTDYYIGLVRYGDHNHICLQAKACGAKVISYTGNQYADYWIPEGDQRVITSRLIEILTGKREPMQTKDVPSLDEMVKSMVKVYEDVK